MQHSWWGKVLGAVFGYLIAGPFGALLGILVGNVFDKGLGQTWVNQRLQAEHSTKAQHAFFTSSFLVMGHVAKADGRVSEDEIRLARDVMKRMQLNDVQKRQAIAYFTKGKQPQFNLNKALDDLMSHCGQHRLLLKTFLDIQYQAAMADGKLGPNKQKILATICHRLGFAPIFGQYQRYYDWGSNKNQSFHDKGPTSSLEQAYALLEITPKASKSEVKKAYRKLMGQNHPDKLIAQGLPEEMIKIATDKTQKIQSAYDKICKARGF